MSKRFAQAEYRRQLSLRYSIPVEAFTGGLPHNEHHIDGYSDAAAVRRQKEREANQAQKGIDRYLKSVDSVTNNPSVRASEADTQPGRWLMHEILDALIPENKGLQNQAIERLLAKGGSKEGRATDTALLSLHPAPLALITARTAFTTIRLLDGNDEGSGKRQETRRTPLSAAVGKYILQEKHFERLRKKERMSERNKIEYVDFIELMKAHSGKVPPSRIKTWNGWSEQINKLNWGSVIQEKMGQDLLDGLVSCGDWFDKKKIPSYKGGFKTEFIVEPTFKTVQTLKAAHGRCELLKPWLSPMVCPPSDWAWDKSACQYRGGYLLADKPLIRWTPHGHTSDAERPATQVVLDAVNAIQNTPWRINGHIYDVMRRAWELGLEIAGLPQQDDVPLPDDFPPAQWKGMTEEERKRHGQTRRAVYAENDRLNAKRSSLDRTLNLAEELLDERAIWFPHNLDYRGRCYPLPQDLQPQGDDFARALLTFAEGKPIGERGIVWLINYVASLFGDPWETFDDRQKWVGENSDQIRAAVADPLNNDWWCRADKPWQFLAAAQEWVSCDNNPKFVSSFPVHVDGSNNGLAHLAALGRDAHLGRYTNLTKSETRQDLYAEVADRVNDQIVDDAENGHIIAKRWLGKVTRKIAKRPVMTRPYGVSKFTMRNQIIDEGHTNGLEGSPGENATYLRDLLWKTIDETIGNAPETMKWLRSVAKQLGEKNLPMEWEPPTGLKVRQAYYQDAWKRIKTLFGEGRAGGQSHEQDRSIDSKEQVNGAVPNFIHSLDAAHMMMTVVAAREVFGIRNFSMIHDSFGVLAGDQQSLYKVIREEFVKMYQGSDSLLLTISGGPQVQSDPEG